MNKEEIDNLENYLKNELPKIELEIPVTAFGSVDLDDLMVSIKRFKNVPRYDELLRENKRLREQLEEKDKVIDVQLKKIRHIYNMLNKYKENHIICFDKDLWGLYNRIDKELVEILERGRNNGK